MDTLTPSELLEIRQRLRQEISRLEGREVLVIGDLGLDEYLDGEVRRISPEAPVPVVEVKAQGFRVGLAGNVAQNIQTLGGMAALIGISGDDSARQSLAKLLREVDVSDADLVIDRDRPTTRKVRVMSGQHHVVRVDFEERKYLSPAVETALVEKFSARLKTCAGVIVQDYGKGIFSESTIQKVIRLSKDAGKQVVVDPHRTTPLSFYRGADVIKPNRDEAFILSGLNIDDLRLRDNSIVEVGRALQGQTGAPRIVITQGKGGVTLFNGSKVTHVPTEPRQVFDVTGAGDTYIAAFGLAYFSGLSDIEAAVLANAAAGVVVGKIGSVPCTKAELLQALA